MSHKRHEIEALFAEISKLVPDPRPYQIHVACTPCDVSYNHLEELMDAHRHVQKWDEAHHTDFVPFGLSPLADLRHDLDKLHSLILGPKLTFLAWSMERLHRDITIYKAPQLGPTYALPRGLSK